PNQAISPINCVSGVGRNYADRFTNTTVPLSTSPYRRRKKPRIQPLARIGPDASVRSSPSSRGEYDSAEFEASCSQNIVSIDFDSRHCRTEYRRLAGEAKGT